jgi:hypothetical protein
MQEKYTNIIREYFRSHPAVAPTIVEKELGLPNGTIRQALATGRLIPAKHIYSIVCYLADYGLQIDGYSLIHDEVDDTLSGRKWIRNVKTSEKKTGEFVYTIEEYRLFAANFFDLPQIESNV